MAVSAVLAGAGLALAGYGAIKQSQAEKRAKRNLANRPTYTPLPEDDSALNLAESQAGIGMGARARQQLANQTHRNLATSSNAILMGGVDPNAIAASAERIQNSYNNAAIYDDQARQQHLGMLLNEYNRYANMRQGNADKSFQINQYAPWADRQQLYAQQIAGGQQTMNSGINIATSSLASMRGAGGGGFAGRRYPEQISGVQPVSQTQFPVTFSQPDTPAMVPDTYRAPNDYIAPIEASGYTQMPTQIPSFTPYYVNV